MKVIDFRLRPPFRSYLNSFMYDMAALEKSHAARNLGRVSAAAAQKDMDLLIREMDEAGILLGVAPVRLPQNGDNEDAIRLMEKYPGRFLGIPWIDPVESEKALAEIAKWRKDKRCRGIIMEPGLATTPVKWFLNNSDIFPVYEFCQKEGIPVLLSFGGRLAHPQYYAPHLVYEVARRFPTLKLVLCHGGWPFVTEICKVALDFPNVFISPDTWAMDFAPGAADYMTAANYMLQDQMVFGSSYPAIPLKKAVDNYLDRLRPEVAEKILYKNGMRIFNLEEPV